MKKWFSVLMILTMLAIASVSQAATANFSWTTNPNNADGSAANVIGTVTKVYQSSTSPVTIASPVVYTSPAGASSANGVTVTANCGVTYFFAITSTADGNTGAISDTVSGTFACPVPGKPTLNTVIIFK